MTVQQPSAEPAGTDSEAAEPPWVLPLTDIGASRLAEVGGKALHLAELLRGGFRVPPGFCLTTSAYERATDQALLRRRLEELAATPGNDDTALSRGAEAVASLVRAAAVPDEVEADVASSYRRMGPGVAVAVRSSATAEDLPFASFAGQQDTYLAVVGEAEVMDAVRRCWASLWTERAVAYRARQGIDPRRVRIAVVVQQMVDAEVAGVLFTADPVTGRRRRTVIDASPGLGEAVVSGAVNPDHVIVDADSGTVVVRRRGDKRLAVRSRPGGGTMRIEAPPSQDRFCLTDGQLRTLTALGTRVEQHLGSPQDIEWAIDADGIPGSRRPDRSRRSTPSRPAHHRREEGDGSTSASASPRASTSPSRRWAWRPSGSWRPPWPPCSARPWPTVVPGRRCTPTPASDCSRT